MSKISKENVWESRGWRRKATKKQDFLEGCSFRVPDFLDLCKDGEKNGILQYQMALHLHLVICIFSLESCGYTPLVRLKLTYFNASWSKAVWRRKQGIRNLLTTVVCHGPRHSHYADSSRKRTSTLAFADRPLKQEKAVKKETMEYKEKRHYERGSVKGSEESPDEKLTADQK